MARAIWKTFDRRVAAEPETVRARPADRPSACLRAEVEQRAPVFVTDRFFRGHGCFHLSVQDAEHPHLALQHSVARAHRTRNSVVTPRARHPEAREFSDHRIAGDADLTRDLTAAVLGIEQTL